MCDFFSPQREAIGLGIKNFLEEELGKFVTEIFLEVPISYLNDGDFE